MPILPAQLGYKKHVSDHEIWRGHIYIFLLYLLCFFFLIFASEKGLFCVSFIFLHPKSVAVTCGANSYYFTGYKGTVLELLAVLSFCCDFKKPIHIHVQSTPDNSNLQGK